jgi:hypothetical protein
MADQPTAIIVIKGEITPEIMARVNALCEVIAAPIAAHKVSYEVRMSNELAEENIAIARGISKYFDKTVRMTRDRIYPNVS